MNRSEQVGNEFAASMQYLAIATGFASEGLPRLSALFRKQSSEERDHALKFVSYLIDAGGKFQIPAIPAPRHDFKTVEDAVPAALDWEKNIAFLESSLADEAAKPAVSSQPEET